MSNLEQTLRDRAKRCAGPEEFTESLSYEEDAACREQLGTPCSYWARVRAEELPLACRIRWVEAPSWKTTPDTAPAIGVVYTTFDPSSSCHQSEPSVPSLICETHRQKMLGAWTFLPWSPGKKLDVAAAFRWRFDRDVLSRVIAAGGSIDVAALVDGLVIHGHSDPRARIWRVRDLCDHGWLLGKVVPVGSGDATIEGEVALSPAFRELFYDPFMEPYWTVLVPWVEDAFRTEWHPTDKTGPFSTLSCGAFETVSDAVAWGRAKLNGTPYSVRRQVFTWDDGGAS